MQVDLFDAGETREHLIQVREVSLLLGCDAGNILLYEKVLPGEIQCHRGSEAHPPDVNVGMYPGFLMNPVNPQVVLVRLDNAITGSLDGLEVSILVVLFLLYQRLCYRGCPVRGHCLIILGSD